MVGAGRARRGARMGTVPNSEGSVGHPGTFLTNQRAPGRGAGGTVAAVTRNLLKLKPHVGPTCSCLLELAPSHLPGLLPGLLLQVAVHTFHALLLFAPSSRPREWRPGFPPTWSTAGSRGLTRRPGPVLLCFLPSPSGLESPFAASICLHSHPSNMEEKTRPSKPSRPLPVVNMQLEERRQDAKQEQVEQTCSNEDSSQISVL